MYLIPSNGGCQGIGFFLLTTRAQRDLRQPVFISVEKKCIILLDMSNIFIQLPEIPVRGKGLEMSVSTPNKMLV